jgi:hypothetical protein
VIEATNVEGDLNVRSLDVLSADADRTAFAVAADLAGAVAISLFASGSHEVRTLIVDPRRGHSLTTDARMLHARVGPRGTLDRVCAVDFTFLDFEGACTVAVSSATVVHDLDVSFGSDGHARLVSSRSVSGVNVTTGGPAGRETDAIKAARLAAHR